MEKDSEFTTRRSRSGARCLTGLQTALLSINAQRDVWKMAMPPREFASVAQIAALIWAREVEELPERYRQVAV